MANPVLKRIKQIGREVGASPKEVKAAIETGLVESNLRNLPGGDADSAGWRQERKSIYKDPTNLDASIRRFFRETAVVKDKYGSAGQLAAAVQRPAAQYRGRYQQASSKADALMGALRGSQLSGNRVGSMAPDTTTVAPAPYDEAGARQQVLQQYLAERGRPGAILGLAGGLGAVADQARASVPQRPDPVPRNGPLGTGSATSPAIGSGNGAFKITGPNPGRIKKSVRDFAEKTSAIYGKPLVGSDGTGHSRLTVNGNVSQHTTGNATDIPASGRALILMGQAALEAAGMPRAQARKQKGGLYNVNGHQIIFNTHEGGDHTDHLHISAR